MSYDPCGDLHPAQSQRQESREPLGIPDVFDAQSGGLAAIIRGSRNMPEDPHSILDRIREFQRTFEQRYGRQMTEEERSILEVAKENIQQKLGTEFLEKAAD